METSDLHDQLSTFARFDGSEDLGNLFDEML